MTQTASHRDVPEQPSASVLQDSMSVPLTCPWGEQEVPSPRLGSPCQATVMTLSVNLNPPAPQPPLSPVLTSDLELLTSKQRSQSSLRGGMTPQTFASSRSANFAAEDAACQADVCEGPTFVGLVILETEGCQRLKAAAAPTYRPASYRDAVAFSWKGWWLMSVATLTFLHTIIPLTCTQLCFYKLTCSHRGVEVFSHFVLSHKNDRQTDRQTDGL